MNQPERVCGIDDIPLGKGREFVVGGRVIAVFHSEEGFHALDGICPHAGGPLAQGMLRQRVVTCPWHGWQFDVTTGCHQINARIAQQTYAVVLRDGDIYVDLAPTTPGP